MKCHMYFLYTPMQNNIDFAKVILQVNTISRICCIKRNKNVHLAAIIFYALIGRRGKGLQENWTNTCCRSANSPAKNLNSNACNN